ncbi:ricin B-like lectins [Clavulina sp. PMI_390]|nr:ricin B-like lectins [Clavulina sp. PMI_390]
MSVSIGGVYTIVNKATGTVADWNQTDLRSLIGWSSHGGANQQWLIEDAGNGLYYIRSAKGTMPYVSFMGAPMSLTKMLCTNTKFAWKIVKDPVDASCLKILHPNGMFCLDLTGSRSANGTPIILYPLHNGRNQAWTFKPMLLYNPDIAPFFFIINKYTNTVADLAANKRNVVGAYKASSSTQIWTTEAADKSQSLYYIKNVGTGTYLSINGSPSPTNPLLSTTTKQKWQIRLQGSALPQMVKIYYPGTDYLIDLTASNSKPGTPIIVYPTQNPGLNQTWKIEAAT